MLKILSGKLISQEIEQELIQKIKTLSFVPKLVIVQVGDKEESNTYIRRKIEFAKRIGVDVEYKKYDEAVEEQEIISAIQSFNEDTSVQGIIVQLPIPLHLNCANVLETICKEKDVDGLTSASVNSLLHNEPGFVSGATKAVLTIVDREQIDLTSKKVVVVGHSALVGKPTALALMNRNATVTVCHAFTKNLAEETRRADVLITAVGKPNLIGAANVCPGQIVIDIGITVISDKQLGKKVVGDVDFDAVKDIVGAITPVPGGVGPLTIACLFENLVEACLMV